MIRAYFLLCLALGWLLRSARYSKTRVVSEGGTVQVRKHRSFYAPFLIWIAGPLVRVLDTGVRVLPQREWEERERRIWWRLRGMSIQIDADGTLVLPRIAGETLAAVLGDSKLTGSIRTRAIESAVVALADLHRLGLTHADAMAENVLVDREAGVAHWFDFETVHEANRPLAWRQADDVRALLVTCLNRTAPAQHTEVLQLILEAYPDQGVVRLLAASFNSLFRRSLSFHLAQAGLSFQSFRAIARLLESIAAENHGEPGGTATRPPRDRRR